MKFVRFVKLKEIHIFTLNYITVCIKTVLISMRIVVEHNSNRKKNITQWLATNIHTQTRR